MVNISLFRFYGSCRKGFGSENGPVLRKGEPVPVRQEALSQQSRQPLRVRSHSLLRLVIPPDHAPVNAARQRHEVAKKGKRVGDTEPALSLVPHVPFPSANSDAEHK